MGLPVGLVYDPADHVVLDPDTGVRDALHHVFTVFARTGSARAVVQEFNRSGLRFPVRIRKGPHKGELAWSPLTHSRVLRTLHNPRYAGAFVYGQRREGRTPAGKTTSSPCPASSGSRSSTTRTPATCPGSSSRPTSSSSWPTPPRTAATGTRDQPEKAPRCCKAWPSAGHAGGG